MSDDPEILERLARLETEVKWLKNVLAEVRKDVNRSRWELLSGIVFVIAMQIVIRLLMG
jgi:preprotein translocase subunit SecE